MRRIDKVELRRGVVLKKSTQLRLIDEVHTATQGMPPVCVGEVIAELKLVLARLLRHVHVCSELGGVRERDGWCAQLGVDQVVPILEPDGECVHRVRGKQRTQRDVRQDQIIDGVVALGQVHARIGLIIVALVVLRDVTDKCLVLVVKNVIDAAVVTLLIERSRNGTRRLRRHGKEAGLLLGQISHHC